MRKGVFSSARIILLSVTLLLPGCGGGKKHDCQQNGHEWVSGKSGEVRCKFCGVYQQKEVTNDKKDSKE